jgi:hypothetical protein
LGEGVAPIRPSSRLALRRGLWRFATLALRAADFPPWLSSRPVRSLCH